MFKDVHVRELKPQNYYEHVVGEGSFGKVYSATWRGQRVAVKELFLPEEPRNKTEAAQTVARERIRQVVSDFTSEIEVCADLAHTNLVRLLGYSTAPRLLIVQELMLGGGLDKQLYVEQWRPTIQEKHKVALDIAQGMKYLHTRFNQPIIHRDLKSPNLLLVAPPTDAAPLTVKITDFGLSKDKAMMASAQKTAMMSGCGSALWMAPEILLGKTYNEKVDVFSFAMCLIELMDHHLPWHGYGGPAEVPFKVTSNQRPTSQLKHGAEHTELTALVKSCMTLYSCTRGEYLVT